SLWPAPTPPPVTPSFLHASPHHRHLSPFPTRRSSDLHHHHHQHVSVNTFPLKLKLPNHCSHLLSPSSRLCSLRSTVQNLAHKDRSEEHTSELQSRFDLVCRLLLEKKKKHDVTHADWRD